MSQVTISMPNLPGAVSALTKAYHQGAVRALQEVARIGHTALPSTITNTVPAPIATGTYRQAWKVKKTKNGAILGNTTFYSYFVEKGRLAGRMPPVSKIEEWMRVKKIAPSFAVWSKGRRRSLTDNKSYKSVQTSKKRPKASVRKQKALTGRKPRGRQHGPLEAKWTKTKKQYSNAPKVKWRKPRAPTWKKSMTALKREKRAQMKLFAAQLPALHRSLAFWVAYRIGKRGIKGRFVLQRTVPVMEAALGHEVTRALNKVSANPPRRGGTGGPP